MNLIEAQRGAAGVQLQVDANSGAAPVLDLSLPATASARLTLGLRANDLRLGDASATRPGAVTLPGVVELAEISGSDTFVHVATAVGELVAQFTGVHRFALGAALTLTIDPPRVYAFDADGDLLRAPERRA